MNLHFLFLIGVFLAPVAHSTSFYIRPFSEFARDTPNMVRGHLHGTHSEWVITSDGIKSIYTYARLEITEVLKGPIKRPEIQIRKPGGTKDGLTLDIPSSPEFHENEETVLFLGPETDDHSYEVVGMELGKFGIEEKNGETILKGGIFNYSHEHVDDFGQSNPESNPENKRSWSIKDVKTLVQTQSVNPPQKESRPAVSAQASAAPMTQIQATPIPKTPLTESSPSSLLTPSATSKTDAPKTVPASFAWVVFLAGAAFFGIFLYLRRK
jgi:hypothetical protein